MTNCNSIRRITESGVGGKWENCPKKITSTKEGGVIFPNAIQRLSYLVRDLKFLNSRAKNNNSHFSAGVCKSD